MTLLGRVLIGSRRDRVRDELQSLAQQRRELQQRGNTSCSGQWKRCNEQIDDLLDELWVEMRSPR